MRNKSPQNLTLLTTPATLNIREFFLCKTVHHNPYARIKLHVRFYTLLKWENENNPKKAIFDYLNGAKRENLSWNIIKI